MFVVRYVLGYTLVTFKHSGYRCVVANTDSLKSQQTSIFGVAFNECII